MAGIEAGPLVVCDAGPLIRIGEEGPQRIQKDNE